MCFSRLRSKGSRFTLGVWGLRVCSFDVHAQPSATVRNRPREGRMAVPIVSFAKEVAFGGFTSRVASVRVAGFPRSALHTSHFTLTHTAVYTPHLTLHTLHSTLRTVPSTVHTPHFTHHTFHFTSTLHTLHFTLHTLHTTL